MILAGQRLDKARSQYDFESEEDIDEDLYDPTRSGNYDLADATQSALDIELASERRSKTLSDCTGSPRRGF